MTYPTSFLQKHAFAIGQKKTKLKEWETEIQDWEEKQHQNEEKILIIPENQKAQEQIESVDTLILNGV